MHIIVGKKEVDMLLSNDYYERVIYERFVKELVKDIKNFVLARLRQENIPSESERELQAYFSGWNDCRQRLIKIFDEELLES